MGAFRMPTTISTNSVISKAEKIAKDLGCEQVHPDHIALAA